MAHEVDDCLLGPGHSYAGLMRGAWNRKDAPEMSRLSLHLTKQEVRKAVARLTVAEPAAQREQSQTRPAFLRAWCKSERLMLLVHRRERCARERNRARGRLYLATLS